MIFFKNLKELIIFLKAQYQTQFRLPLKKNDIIGVNNAINKILNHYKKF